MNLGFSHLFRSHPAAEARPTTTASSALGGIAIIVVLFAAVVASVQSQPNDTYGIGSKIVYVEFQAADLVKTKVFFEHTFGWNFAEQTPTYFTFFDGRISGGFAKSEKCGKRANGTALISIYSENLEETRRKITANGGRIVQDIVISPDGRRIIFEEPSGNEFIVVSSK